MVEAETYICILARCELATDDTLLELEVVGHKRQCACARTIVLSSAHSRWRGATRTRSTFIALCVRSIQPRSARVVAVLDELRRGNAHDRPLAALILSALALGALHLR